MILYFQSFLVSSQYKKKIIMTIIYSNAEDIDCHVLRYAFENLKDVNLVEIDKSSVNWVVHVNEAISRENDFIMFLGHGDEYGLYSPNFDSYILDKNNG